MNNFELATEATATALNSQGSSMREQAKYADSLEARINRLDTAWNKLTLSTGTAFLTDGLIAAVETLNDLAGATTWMIDKFGVLSGVFGTLGVATVLLSTRFRTFTTALIFGTQGMTRAALATAGLRTGMTQLGVATVGATAALRGLLASTLVGAAFVAIGFAIEKLISAYSEAKQKQEEFEESQKKNINALTENKKQTDELIASYKQLSAQKENGQWDTEKEKEYLRVQQQLGDLFPSLIAQIDATGQNHLIAADRIDKEIEATKELLELKKEEVRLKALETFEDNIDKRDGFFGLEKDIERKRNQIQQAIDVGVKGTEINKMKQELNRMESELATTSLKINDHVLKVAEAYSKLEVDPTIKKSVQDLVSSLDLTDLSATELEAYSMKVSKLMDDMQRAYENADSKGFDNAKNALTDYVQSMGATDVQASVLGVTFDKVKENADRLAGATYSGADGMDAFTDSMADASEQSKDFAKSFDDAVSKIESLNKIINDLNDGKGVSADSISTLIENYPELLEYINDEATLRTKINEIIDQEVKVAKQAMVEKLKYSETFYINTIKNNKIFVDQLNKTYGIDLNAYKDLNSAKIAVDNATRERLSKAWETFYQNISAAARASTDGMEVMTGALMNRAQNIMAEQTKVSADFNDIFLDQVDILTDGSLAMSGLSDGTKKSAKEYENAFYISDKFKNSLESINLQIEKQNSLQSKTLNYSKQYETALKKEIALQNEKKKLLQDQAKALESQIKQGKIQPTGIVTTSSSSYSPASTTGGSNSSQIWNFFKSKGFTDNIVAGIMGNLQLESGLNSNALNKSSGAFGIAQWLGGRKKALQSYANSVGTSINDLNTQLNFLWSELNSTEKKTLNYLNNNRGASASSIAAAFDKLFERSEGTHIPQRQQYANQFLSQFSGTVATTGSVSEAQSKASKEAAQGLQEVDQAKSELIQLKQDLIAVEAEIEKANLELLKLPIAVYEKRIADQDKNIKNTTNSLYNLTEGTSEYGFKLRQLIAYHQERQVQNEKEIQYMRQLIGSGKLSAIQVAELSEELQTLLDRRYEIAQSRDEINSQIVGNSLYTYASAIEEVNSKLEMSQALQQSFAEGSEAFNHETEQQNNLLQEKKAILTQQIAKLTELIGKQNLSKEATKEFTDQLKQLKLELVNTNNALFSTRAEVADNAINAIRKSYEMQREYETKLKEKQIKDLEEVHDLRMKQYDEDLNRYEEIINEKIRLLDDQDDEDKWNKDLSNMQKQQLDLQSKISVLARSSSMSDYARRIELEEQLAELTEQIEEKKNDRSKELLKRGLTDQLDSFKKEIDRKKKAEDEQFNATKTRLERERDEIERHYNEILNDETYFASLRQNIINGNVEETKKKIKEFLEEFKKMNKDIIKELGLSWTELQSMINNATGSLGGLDGVGNSGSSNSAQKKSDWHTYLNNKRLAETGNPTPERAAQLRAANDALRKKWGFPDGSYDYLKNNPPKFHKGGIVNGSGNKLVNLANILFNKKPNEQHILALREELFSPKENIINKFIPNLRDVVGSGNGGGNIYHLSPTIQVTVNGNDKNIGKSIAEQTFEAMGEILRDWGK